MTHTQSSVPPQHKMGNSPKLDELLCDRKFYFMIIFTMFSQKVAVFLEVKTCRIFLYIDFKTMERGKPCGGFRQPQSHVTWARWMGHQQQNHPKSPPLTPMESLPRWPRTLVSQLARVTPQAILLLASCGPQVVMALGLPTIPCLPRLVKGFFFYERSL